MCVCVCVCEWQISQTVGRFCIVNSKIVIAYKREQKSTTINELVEECVYESVYQKGREAV